MIVLDLQQTPQRACCRPSWSCNVGHNGPIDLKFGFESYTITFFSVLEFQSSRTKFGGGTVEDLQGPSWSRNGLHNGPIDLKLGVYSRTMIFFGVFELQSEKT